MLSKEKQVKIDALLATVDKEYGKGSILFGNYKRVPDIDCRPN